ncbi:MAG: hypothetical protein QXO37_07430 [Candidatus Nitrosocaldaceae archaeon]
MQDTPPPYRRIYKVNNISSNILNVNYAFNNIHSLTYSGKKFSNINQDIHLTYSNKSDWKNSINYINTNVRDALVDIRQLKAYARTFTSMSKGVILCKFDNLSVFLAEAWLNIARLCYERYIKEVDG